MTTLTADQTVPASRAEIDSNYYNPFDPAFTRNPWPVWRKLVLEHELCFHRDLRMWLINSHELAADILVNPKFTSNHKHNRYAPEVGSLGEPGDFERTMEKMLPGLEPEEHLRMRRLTMPAFSRKVMDKIEGNIRDLIVSAFDAIGDVDEFDVYAKISERLPARALARMVGIPPEYEEEFLATLGRNLTIAARFNLPIEQRIEAKQKTQPGFDLLKKLIAERRALENPGDDFLGTLIKAEYNGDRLDESWEIIALIVALINAGSDTAVDLYSYLFKTLLGHPEQFRMLRENPELFDNALLEILRHSAFGLLGSFRFPLEDMEFGGQRLLKGEPCAINLSTAWNDPRKWPNPEKFDITRSFDGNIIFGAGAHFCVGTFLARVQARVAFEEISRRFPNAELTGEIEYDYTNLQARRISKLMVRTHAKK